MCGADSVKSPRHDGLSGSSPRVRSRPSGVSYRITPQRIISACAEQTQTIERQITLGRDHLRVCGADTFVSTTVPPMVGSSPRVRSRLRVFVRARTHVGIISACAEQTVTVTAVPTLRRDHLRVCGADEIAPPIAPVMPGSSPRVRSRRDEAGCVGTRRGIISACAEQTVPVPAPVTPAWDHLRVCGADRIVEGRNPQDRGSSPRVRSRRVRIRVAVRAIGIISACAEQTATTDDKTLQRAGSSPRVRSRQTYITDYLHDDGIISACAEQTPTPIARCSGTRDHLRVCGADSRSA